ncbi:MAG: rhamnogalacturonan acetylesterase [Cyclobacteriaceae bacterium]|nr:rhamnogalacturonan acetylesterase [Cyclobacteriaceae bacterium]UYN85779.1 MAG: rhamnogalacturonan acetylesterase [Cyclobacteriaceae bacterium]
MKSSLLYVLVFFFIVPFSGMQNKITVYLIGDSTMASKASTAYPETGWGMPFAHFFDSTVVVENHAMNGRSTRTFISEGRWSTVSAKLKTGDYVFIQFGHNDESKEKTDRYTAPEDYKKNLSRFITESRAKGAVPVLLTPVARRRFDEQGKIMESHPEYSPLVHTVAKQMNAPLIDLDKSSQALYQEFGMENSKLLFLQLKPGEHPNYPEGKDDNTHFNELGARLIAQLVLEEIRNLKLELANRIIKKK